MIEVIVGALLLGITTLAILDGLDGAQNQGRRNKERSVSATLAQQDIERLRAFPIPSLSNYSETRAVNVAGVPYTVSSRRTGSATRPASSAARTTPASRST